MDFVSYLPLILLFVLFFIRIPVAYSMLIVTVVYFLFINDTMPVEMVVQRLVTSTESFPYLAIPFFACAGVVFNYAGITDRLMALAVALVGHMKGSLGQVNVLLSTLMGGLSGSANADAAMDSKILVPQMTKNGYDKAFSTALTAASSCITPIIPPGIILILYAIASDVSIAKMFYAGYLPGLMICAGLMIAVAIISKKRGYGAIREKRATLKEIFKQLLDSVWALLLPFGIIMGLRVGMFTPTEAGAMSVLYAVVIGAFIYRKLKWSDIPAIIKESIMATAGVMFIIGAANAFGSYLTWERIPLIVSDALINNISDPFVLLLIINLLLLVVGCFLEGGAAMVMLAPLLVPAAAALGVDLVHFGIIMCINLTIAGFTPPFGTMMFVTTSITGVKIEQYTRASLPFLLVLLLVLFLVTYIPQIVLFIPNLLS
ncbi:TRAP transporter large permease [Paenibacillus ginsengihumi]|uniref:TRAP transporter large permease n=1 Tax=Paenibacillus ginsengihumi TaxID=431596 RepID=UPI000362C703|nr:TRAP transporter large permease [Paenibacillus ginsengihumi]